MEAAGLVARRFFHAGRKGALGALPQRMRNTAIQFFWPVETVHRR
jgi:hypothetical protein